MRHSFKTGLSFGLTSGITTTLGVIVGLHAGTHSRLAVIGAILTIALSDAFSDALGIHISQESENRYSPREVWESTASTFLFKFVSAITFIVPVTWLSLEIAILTSVFWGLLLLALFSFYLAREQGAQRWKVISEHVGTAVLVVVLSHYVGVWVGKTFG
jgi:VIT1/CCC1 family predicted Fe2+/Mn2+ transporter